MTKMVDKFETYGYYEEDVYLSRMIQKKHLQLNPVLGTQERPVGFPKDP